MAWRLARSLETLRSEINSRWPQRSKASDGTIGDDAHAARRSDHNPDGGVVEAIDFTAAGIDIGWLFEHLRQLGANGFGPLRGGYLILNRKTAGTESGWRWVTYRGSNPHEKHGHVSASDDPRNYDSTQSWGISGVKAGPPPPAAGPPAGNDGGPLREGSRGPKVGDLQAILQIKVDQVFGPATKAALIEFQHKNGLTPDGIAGPATFNKIDAIIRWLTAQERPTKRTLRLGDSGADVSDAQRRLILHGSGHRTTPDGKFGPNTLFSVKHFQNARHLPADGIVGPLTWVELLK